MTITEEVGNFVKIEISARDRLDELREALAKIVKSFASAEGSRKELKALSSDDIDAAWDAIVATKHSECDISAARIMGTGNSYAGEAIQRICDLKWELSQIVERRAMENVVAEDRNVIRLTDIDKAWDEVTYGKCPHLAAGMILSEERADPALTP